MVARCEDVKDHADGHLNWTILKNLSRTSAAAMSREISIQILRLPCDLNATVDFAS
jgi:hypothetical protein